MHQDTFYQVALSRVPLVGPKTFRSLVEHFGSAEEFFRSLKGKNEGARTQVLRQIEGASARLSGHLAGEAHLREAERILHHAERNELRIFCCTDPDYPAKLFPYPNSGPVLYHYGATDFSNPRSVAVVGTRQMSSRGGCQVDRLLDPLAEYAPLIVSGLAYGVDIYAHRRCLKVGLPTLAVMGSGFNQIYPAAHAKTARRLIETGGGVLTAHPFWVKPHKDHFPARNRIVAMLSDLTVIVESARRGGSMITARMAGELKKMVGACPGRGGDPLTEGCNELIKTGRAHLLESGQDVVRLLGWKGKTAGVQRRLFDDLSPAEQSLADHLRDRDGVDIDELHHALSVPPAALAGTLLMLEMKGVIASLPGHRYRLTG